VSRRSALAAAGLARAKEFSWSSSADAHVNAWQRSIRHQR
jgi:hypothetical protein